VPARYDDEIREGCVTTCDAIYGRDHASTPACVADCDKTRRAHASGAKGARAFLIAGGLAWWAYPYYTDSDGWRPSPLAPWVVHQYKWTGSKWDVRSRQTLKTAAKNMVYLGIAGYLIYRALPRTKDWVPPALPR